MLKPLNAAATDSPPGLSSCRSSTSMSSVAKSSGGRESSHMKRYASREEGDDACWELVKQELICKDPVRKQASTSERCSKPKQDFTSGSSGFARVVA